MMIIAKRVDDHWEAWFADGSGQAGSGATQEEAIASLQNISGIVGDLDEAVANASRRSSSPKSGFFTWNMNMGGAVDRLMEELEKIRVEHANWYSLANFFRI